MNVRFFFFLCFCVCVLPGKTQDYPRHAVYAESGTGFLFASVNYEYHVVASARECTSFRAGLGLLQVNQPGAYLFLPLELLWTNAKRFSFEAGPGLTLSYGHRFYTHETGALGTMFTGGSSLETHYYDVDALLQLRLGIRYQSLPKGITARLGLLLIHSSKRYDEDLPVLWPWPSAAIGYAF